MGDVAHPPPPPPRAILPRIIAALAVGVALSAGGFVMMDRGDPSTVPIGEPPIGEPPIADPPIPDPDPPIPELPEPEPVNEPEPANDPSPAPATTPEPIVAPEPVTAPAPLARPAASPEPDPAPEPTPAPTHATVSFTGADSLKLEEVDFRHRFSPGEVPPGRYKILAGFGGADPVSAGELTLSAGQTVHLECDPDFRRCRSK